MNSIHLLQSQKYDEVEEASAWSVHPTAIILQCYCGRFLYNFLLYNLIVAFKAFF